MEVQKRYTSIPKHLFRMRMVLPSQKKIPRATKISSDMSTVRKERLMLKWGTFKKVTGRITIKLIMFVVLCLKGFLPARGALQTCIPQAIVNG